MLRIITLTIILAILVAAGIYLAYLSGYVLLAFPHFTAKLPLWEAILSLLVICIVFYVLVRLLRLVFTLRRRMQRWAEQKQAKQAQYLLDQGLFALLSLQLETAKLKLTKAALQHKHPLYAQLGLVLVAHEQLDIAARDELLEKLFIQYPANRLAIGILQARLQLTAGNSHAACVNLAALYQTNSGHVGVLALLAEAYYQEKEWVALNALLPAVQRVQAIHKEVYNKYMTAIVQDQLLHATSQDVLLLTWRKAEVAVQQSVAVLTTYVQQLLHYNLAHEAETVVRTQIDTQNSNELYKLYASIPADTHQQILQIETWLKSKPYDATLLFAAGQHCLRYQLWGKAKDYFLLSAQQQPTPQIYLALAKLFEQLGDKEQALRHYKLGLSL